MMTDQEYYELTKQAKADLARVFRTTVSALKDKRVNPMEGFAIGQTALSLGFTVITAVQALEDSSPETEKNENLDGYMAWLDRAEIKL